jgi:aconitate hydratase
MGVLPLEFFEGQTWKSLGLNGEEIFDVKGLDDQLQPRSEVTVTARAADGSITEFKARVRIDTPVEMDYYRNGGILQTVLRKLLDKA